MSPRHTLARLTALSILLVGCQARETDVAVTSDTAAPDRGAAALDASLPIAAFRFPAATAGHLQLVGRRLRFIACGTEGAATTIEDNATEEATALLRELDTADNGINVVMRMSEGRVEQIRYGAAEGVGCDRLPPDGELDAKGNEPFWSLRVDGDSATFRTPESPDGTTYIGGRWSQPDAQHWRHVSTRAGTGAGASPDTLVATLTESRCIDSMSGARYPFQVTLTRAGSTLTGCALEGRRSFRQ